VEFKLGNAPVFWWIVGEFKSKNLSIICISLGA
jgi:hypothetical protein